MSALTIEAVKPLIVEGIANVGRFMRCFGQPTPTGWQDANVDAFPLRRNLIVEEFEELLNAKTKIDALDGLCDLLYVSIGASITCGFRWFEISHGVNRSLQRAVGDAAVRFLQQPCQAGLRNATSDLVVTVALHGSRAFGVTNFKKAFDAVHTNNMEKLWTQEELSQRDPGDTFRVVYEIDGPRKCVVLRADGKVKKSPNHKKVDLTPYV